MVYVSEVLSPGREPNWLGWRSPDAPAKEESLTVMTHLSSFKMVLRRTIMWKEAGVS